MHHRDDYGFGSNARQQVGCSFDIKKSYFEDILVDYINYLTNAMGNLSSSSITIIIVYIVIFAILILFAKAQFSSPRPSKKTKNRNEIEFSDHKKSAHETFDYSSESKNRKTGSSTIIHDDRNDPGKTLLDCAVACAALAVLQTNTAVVETKSSECQGGTGYHDLSNLGDSGSCDSDLGCSCDSGGADCSCD